MTRQVGIVPENLADRIQALSIKQLETLTEDLLEFAGLDDLIAWMDTNG